MRGGGAGGEERRCGRGEVEAGAGRNALVVLVPHLSAPPGQKKKTREEGANMRSGILHRSVSGCHVGSTCQ
jgi:hypothetical protein